MYDETGHKPLFAGDRKKPENCPDMRSMRDAMEDPRNMARKTRINNHQEERRWR